METIIRLKPGQELKLTMCAPELKTEQKQKLITDNYYKKHFTKNYEPINEPVNKWLDLYDIYNDLEKFFPVKRKPSIHTVGKALKIIFGKELQTERGRNKTTGIRSTKYSLRRKHEPAAEQTLITNNYNIKKELENINL